MGILGSSGEEDKAKGDKGSISLCPQCGSACIKKRPSGVYGCLTCWKEFDKPVKKKD